MRFNRTVFESRAPAIAAGPRRPRTTSMSEMSQNTKQPLIAHLGIAILSLCSASAAGRLVPIEYFDERPGNPALGGPLWTGYVDTDADTLTIQTWQEYPLHGPEFWVPRNLVPEVGATVQELVWPARNSSGDLHDVPETFNGRIDGTFAFISNLSLVEMNAPPVGLQGQRGWYQPVFVDPDGNGPQDPVFDHYDSVTFTLGVDDNTLGAENVWPGWGGYAREYIIDGKRETVFHTENPKLGQEGQSAFDERIMHGLAVSATLYGISSNATVTVGADVHPIPEASGWLAATIASIIGVGSVAVHRLRR